MLCLKCSREFEPTLEESRLIAGGHLTPICDECAPTPVVAPPIIESEATGKEVFWRAERTDTTGKIVAYMVLPKKIQRPKINPLRKPRKDQLKVFVMTEGGPQQHVTVPRVILHTNLETFIKDKQPFWVRKLPDYWDGQTGVARIEVKLEEVQVIIKEKSLIRVRCQDGSEIRLYYRRSRQSHSY